MECIFPYKSRKFELNRRIKMLFGCANDEQFLDELKLPPLEFEWNPGKEFNIGPESLEKTFRSKYE